MRDLGALMSRVEVGQENLARSLRAEYIAGQKEYDGRVEVGQEFDFCHGGHVRLVGIDPLLERATGRLDLFTFLMIRDVDRRTFKINRGDFTKLHISGAIRDGWDPREGRL